MSKRNPKIAIAQMYAEPLAKEANATKILSLIDEAASQGAHVVVLPEIVDLGCDAAWGNDAAIRKEILSLAEFIPGPFTEKIADKARLHNIHIFFSMYERGPEEEPILYNAGVFAMPSGEIVVYRKMHLYIGPMSDERFYVKPGHEFKVVDTAVGRIGLLICYDITQPESARVLALRGAEIILHPNAWPEDGYLRYESLIPARAVENQLYVVSSGQCGPDMYGHSRLVDFAGKELVRFGREEGVKSATIQLDAELRWRKDYLPYFLSRRPDKYADLCAEDHLYESFGK